ncbi:uncharacterized protein LOC131490937 [Neofelis nebulosa]|uniref:uncharacterized protein LOC131490937 n=1 Tax=Neofelis nebulosa TaxID=61452 RepID=UPI00272B24FC|nr:uncharacterized protein LOC131490937 [Neofelis nebulosa]
MARGPVLSGNARILEAAQAGPVVLETRVIVGSGREPVTAHHVARNPLPGGDKRATATGSGHLSSVGYSRLTMNVLRLALVLTLLGGPQALHMGPQDPNFTENLVDGNWFSTARASNEPKLLRTDSDTMLFIHKIHVTFKTMQFHVHRRVKGRCIPIVLTASETRRKFQYVLKRKYGPAASSSPGVGGPGDSRAENGQELSGQDAASQEGPTGCGTPWALSAAGGWDAGHNTIFVEKADPHRSVVFCIHNRRHRKKTVMVDLLTSRTERKVLSDPILASTPAHKQRDPAVAGGPHAVPEATRATACTTGDTVSHESRQDPHRGLGHPAHVQGLLREPRDRPTDTIGPTQTGKPPPPAQPREAGGAQRGPPLSTPCPSCRRPLPARPTVERLLGPGPPPEPHIKPTVSQARGPRRRGLRDRLAVPHLHQPGRRGPSSHQKRGPPPLLLE